MIKSHRSEPPRPVVFALLWLDASSSSVLCAALEGAGLVPAALLKRFHLTVYHARRKIPDLRPLRRSVSIDCDVAEMRTMVLVPGGENPRPGVKPSRRSLALRLTRRNCAIPDIQALRGELTCRETSAILGNRPGSSRNRSAFGARNFQPHIKFANRTTMHQRIYTRWAITCVPSSRFCGSASMRSLHILNSPLHHERRRLAPVNGLWFGERDCDQGSGQMKYTLTSWF